MNYKISHTTTYTYTETVPVCQNVAHLTPRDTPTQTCRYHRLLVKPGASSSTKHTDYFGNPINYFSVVEGHRKLTITSVSRVDVRRPPVADAATSSPWELVRDSLRSVSNARSLETYQFVFDSPHIERTTELGDYARQSFTPGRPMLEAIRDLNTRIHSDFVYDPKATEVYTRLTEVFKKRRGVCQDLAHVGLGCLRSIGLAARYVSGYLRTIPPEGKPRLVGADASHAWLAVFAGQHGWIDIDPTNDALVSTDHITVAWGRDYSDVAPINGLYVGGGQHTLAVAVDVMPVSDGHEE